MLSRFVFCVAGVLSLAGARACELCAIYGAASARGENSSGFVFTIAEQDVAKRTTLLEGEDPGFNNGRKDYLNSSYLHFVPTYNFSERFGVSLNLPYIRRDFRRDSVRFVGGNQVFYIDETGRESGIGDLAAVARVTVFTKQEMEWGIAMNVLAGVKFPTGNTDPLRDEVAQVRAYNQFVGPGHFHDVLGLRAGGVHQSHITLGSGSYDGIFGLTFNSRYDRWFFNAQGQYYLRTEGESGYTFGDEIIVSGGPGAYLWLNKRGTLSVAGNFVYDTQARSTLFGLKSDSTGMTMAYGGPLVTATWGGHLSVQGGVDIPIWRENNGWQNVPSFRVHGGVTWKF